ncbi:universal stress protein [Streptomyces sp. DSM 44917]|uniref:Universal stress protein n=1 Tax=Streptomyces boetiae TaxID=3075541 RepID=A0ABU2LDW0_9ACTN|nr:universal stress protein [Streptomyces sp. DSM 44917]MDT0309774.1 universal stress protein [Streptomyces sp. DSM 44917]
MSGPVVVGVDGSASGLAAVETAAREAQLRGVGLRVVHAFIWPAMHAELGPPPFGPPGSGLRNAADRLVAQAVERARAVAPDVPIATALVTGGPSAVLRAQSRDASLMVVGTRGLGGFTGLLVGSTAVDLAAHGHCPLLVVRGEPAAAGPVVLGTDGSPANAAATEFAFAEAALRGVELVALHAWTPWNAPVPPPRDPAHVYAAPPGDLAAAEERLLAEAVAGLSGKYPDVPVRRTLVRGNARETLIDASRTAGLLVLGARGHGGFAGLVLGSVSQALLHHAHCPLAVVRDRH